MNWKCGNVNEQGEFPPTWVDYWRCRNIYECVYWQWILDGKADCADGSDEVPLYHIGRTCLEGYLRCNNTVQCIKHEYWCDGRNAADALVLQDLSTITVGCQDSSDEGYECETWDCPIDFWKCADGLQCIKAKYVCDGRNFTFKDQDVIIRYMYDAEVYGCKDASDEHGKLCCTHDWPCLDGHGCVENELVCDGNADCNDESDEFLSICRTWNCSEGMWKCHDLKCIDLTKVCDGVAQCNDASDEQACANWTCTNKWRKCNDNIQCIADESVCDGREDCFDLSDEYDNFCIKYQCPTNFTKCANNLQCVKSIDICDGIFHCLDISDEQCEAHCLKVPLGGQKAIIKLALDEATWLFDNSYLLQHAVPL